MDIVSHGLWGGIAFGRKSKKDFLLSFFFGIAPDLFSFGLLFVATWLGLASGPDFHGGPPASPQGGPDASQIPSYIPQLYNITHSFITASVIFSIVWFIRKKPFLPMLAWPLHILVDIPTHSSQFFPTPFLWPLFETQINSIPWSNPYIFFPNLFFLAVLYIWFFASKRKRGIRNLPS